MLYQALAATDFNHPNKNEIIEKVNLALSVTPTIDAAMLLKIRSTPNLKVQLPAGVAERRVNQLIFDPEKNTLTIKHGITSASAKPVVVKSSK